ncbi:hypothetical protein G6F60_006049 [Rhizopus arrhizus]|nr:hypothetical protein G6F66_005478 [Rhizopus arrhizus]KAG1378822.1 hypothetical protein G6F61_005494 [Rhizopus arrhizus]KAG1401932.1 hypothetical protein G6F60_006049 [Rhizopus arrhizus]
MQEKVIQNIYLYILDMHVDRPWVFSKQFIEMYSEADYQYKFWSYIFESFLGRKQDIFLRWGDTISGSYDASFVMEAPDNMGSLVMKIGKAFVTDFAKAKNNSEASFFIKFLWPIINIMFIDCAKKNAVYSVMDGHEKQEKKRPDFMLGIEDRKRELYYFYIELKRPDCDSKYQKEDDFCKLMKQMKTSVDRQIKLKMANPISFGLLCEGFNCSMYQMSLVNDGIYLPVMVKRFSLVENESNLMNIPLIVEALSIVKDELPKLEKRYKGKRKEKTKESEYVKPSYQTEFNK